MATCFFSRRSRKLGSTCRSQFVRADRAFIRDTSGGARLGELEHHHGHVIRTRAVTPGADAVEDLLLHFSQTQVGNITDNLFWAVDTEHLALGIKILSQPIRVYDHAVT